MKRLPLSELVTVALGTYEPPLDQGTYPVLLPSDLDIHGRLNLRTKRFIESSAASERAMLQTDDVLLPAKGNRLAATHVTAELAGHVASSGFFILRPEQQLIVPIFLMAYLNHPFGQRSLREHLKASTTVPVLNKADILMTTILLPSMVEQHRLAELHQLFQREKQLTEELLQLKEKMYQQAFQIGLQ